MKLPAVILVLISLVLTACNQNKPAESQIPVVGDAVDTIAIAEDTLGQKSLEASYEYAQTVVVNPKLVYDIRAYGGPPSHGEYCVIRRGADNKPDTVVQAKRLGLIVNAFTADLNNNGKEEIYIITQLADTFRVENIIGYEFDAAGKSSGIEVHFEPLTRNYEGKDSIFLNGKTICRIFPFFDKYKKRNGWLRINYQLTKNELDHFSSENLPEDWKP